jgi:hypothetical protein
MTPPLGRPPRTPKCVSPADPAASGPAPCVVWPSSFTYATNYLIDTENAVFVDVESTRATRKAEVGAAHHDRPDAGAL